MAESRVYDHADAGAADEVSTQYESILEEEVEGGAERHSSRSRRSISQQTDYLTRSATGNTNAQDAEDLTVIKDLDNKLIAEGCQNATISIFMASLDASMLQYAQATFSGRPARNLDKSINVCLFLSLVMAIGSTLTYSYLTGRSISLARRPAPSAKQLRMARGRVSHKRSVLLYSTPNRNIAAYLLFAAVILFTSDNMSAAVSVPVTIVFMLESLLIAHASFGLMDEMDLGAFKNNFFNKRVAADEVSSEAA